MIERHDTLFFLDLRYLNVTKLLYLSCIYIYRDPIHCERLEHNISCEYVLMSYVGLTLSAVIMMQYITFSISYLCLNFLRLTEMIG